MNLLLIKIIGITALAYLLGAIPFALIISKYKKIDLRKIGSKNLGATNVYRALGLKYALIVFSLDLIKGAIPAYICLQQFNNPWLIVTIGSIPIIAHSLSIFAQFKGGKGAATGLGFLLVLSPKTCLIILLLAILLIKTTRYVAPTTILCAICAPFLIYFFTKNTVFSIYISLISLFIIIRHKENIKRLILGKENRL